MHFSHREVPISGREQIAPEDAVELRRQMRNWLTELYRICERTAPEQWTFAIYRKLTAPLAIEMKPGEQRPVDLEAARRIRAYADFFKEVIYDEATKGRDGISGDKQEVALKVTDTLVHDVAEKFIIPEPLEIREDEKPQYISWEGLRRLPGVQLFLEADRPYVEVTNSQGVKARIPIPTSEQVLHKGGAARIFLKLAAGAGQDLIDAEIPLNDVDVIVCGDIDVVKPEALALGADPEGIEQVTSFKKMRELFSMRDIDLNQCFLGKKGLQCTERALRAAKTGAIEISSRARALYGSETFYYDERVLLKARGLMRLLKFTAEGKAKSFSLSELNTHVPLGIYWLFLIRKFSKKSQFPDLAQRLLYLGKQVQFHPPESSVIDLMDRTHTQFPFFEMQGSNLSEVDVMRWLIKKAIRVVDRYFQVAVHAPVQPFLPTDIARDRRKDVSLEGYVPDEVVQMKFMSEWPRFLERSQVRTDAFRQKNQPQPIFIEEDP